MDFVEIYEICKNLPKSLVCGAIISCLFVVHKNLENLQKFPQPKSHRVAQNDDYDDEDDFDEGDEDDDDDDACEKDGSMDEKNESENGFGFELSPHLDRWPLLTEVGQGGNLKIILIFPLMLMLMRFDLIQRRKEVAWDVGEW